MRLPNVRVREIAHARSGDKGDTAQLSVIAYDIRNYALLEKCLTVTKIADHFAPILKGSVFRYELPSMGALIFVLEHALDTGVTRSLALDAHGKALAATVLDVELPTP